MSRTESRQETASWVSRATKCWLLAVAVRRVAVHRHGVAVAAAGPAQLAGRRRAVGLLLATQLALFASVGLSANQAFGFYASLGGPLRQETDQGVVVDHDGAAARAVRSRWSTPGAWTCGGSGMPRIGGQIQKVAVVGRTTTSPPPRTCTCRRSTSSPQYRTRTFPAAVVLTGYPGTAEALVNGSALPAAPRRTLAKNGRMQPMILVMLRPTVAPPRDTECVDIPRRPADRVVLRQGPARGRDGPLPGGQEARQLGRHRRLHGRLLRPEAGHAPPGGLRGRARACRRTTRRRSTRPPATSSAANKTLRNEADLLLVSEASCRSRPPRCSSPAARPGNPTTRRTLKFIELAKSTRGPGSRRSSWKAAGTTSTPGGGRSRRRWSGSAGGSPRGERGGERGEEAGR